MDPPICTTEEKARAIMDMLIKMEETVIVLKTWVDPVFATKVKCEY
jgi:hypothetical protein